MGRRDLLTVFADVGHEMTPPTEVIDEQTRGLDVITLKFEILL